MVKQVPEILEEAAAVFRERNKQYGNNFLSMGEIMLGFFPEGVHLKTADDFLRWHLFELIAIKMSRYANNFSKGGHQDSVRDLTVYGAMLEFVDEQVKDNPNDSI